MHLPTCPPHPAAVRALPSQVALAEAAAARSLLASLETPSAAAPGGRAARRQQAAALKQQQQQQQYAQMQAQYQQYQQYMQQQQILLGHQMATGLAGLQPPAHLPHATPMYQAGPAFLRALLVLSHATHASQLNHTSLTPAPPLAPCRFAGGDDPGVC